MDSIPILTNIFGAPSYIGMESKRGILDNLRLQKHFAGIGMESKRRYLDNLGLQKYFVGIGIVLIKANKLNCDPMVDFLSLVRGDIPSRILHYN